MTKVNRRIFIFKCENRFLGGIWHWWKALVKWRKAKLVITKQKENTNLKKHISLTNPWMHWTEFFGIWSFSFATVNCCQTTGIIKVFWVFRGPNEPTKLNFYYFYCIWVQLPSEMWVQWNLGGRSFIFRVKIRGEIRWQGVGFEEGRDFIPWAKITLLWLLTFLLGILIWWSRRWIWQIEMWKERVTWSQKGVIDESTNRDKRVENGAVIEEE